MTDPFLRVPPFPGHRGLPLTRPGNSVADPGAVHAALVAERVGGSFWSARPDLPETPFRLLAPQTPLDLDAMLDDAAAGAVLALPLGLVATPRAMGQRALVREPYDPWHLAAAAEEVWASPASEVGQVAALLGKPVRWFGAEPGDFVATLTSVAYSSPFTGADWTILDAIEQLGEWRRLIDANRDFTAIFGVAQWKRVTLDPLLWDGTGPVRHRRSMPSGIAPDTLVVAWKSRTAPSLLNRLETTGATIAELEDGMIRSIGLGANCVPPLSAIVDSTGIYFDPNGPSDLETMIERGAFPSAWLERSARLRTSLVESGISKYGQAAPVDMAGDEDRDVILVTGQVEDDRSVLSGGANCTNLELLKRARAAEPDARIVYKPHPDVEAGHRAGHVPDETVLAYADRIERSAPISRLLGAVRGLHVITSLAGFEALLRGKRVVTHGQPFYAGWGLTEDCAAPNPRRTQRRSLDELIAATLIGYSRYVDPVTLLPCPPEILIQRMAAGAATVRTPLIALREWQGRLSLVWQRLAGARR